MSLPFYILSYTFSNTATVQLVKLNQNNSLEERDVQVTRRVSIKTRTRSDSTLTITMSRQLDTQTEECQ